MIATISQPSARYVRVFPRKLSNSSWVDPGYVMFKYVATAKISVDMQPNIQANTFKKVINFSMINCFLATDK